MAVDLVTSAQNNDYDLYTAAATVFTLSPVHATEALKCYAYLAIGDGVKDLDGSGGGFELTIQIGSQVVQPEPQIVWFSDDVRSGVFTVAFLVPANTALVLKVKSPNAADTDVDVTAYVYAEDFPSGEPAQGAPPASASIADKISYLYKAWRNKTLTTATQISVYDDAGTAVDHKSTISDDGTTFTKGEYASGP